MFKSMIDGTVKLVTATSEDPITNSEARGAAAVVGIVTLIGTSIFTRKRAEEGKPAIGGFLL